VWIILYEIFMDTDDWYAFLTYMSPCASAMTTSVL
jgi:hypothetical protein